MKSSAYFTAWESCKREVEALTVGLRQAQEERDALAAELAQARDDRDECDEQLADTKKKLAAALDPTTGADHREPGDANHET